MTQEHLCQQLLRIAAHQQLKDEEECKANPASDAKDTSHETSRKRRKNAPA